MTAPTSTARSAAAATSAAPPEASPEAAPAAAPPAENLVGGRTEIGERVLERIAARAVSEVDEASGTPRRVLGVPVGRTAGAGPQVTAEVDGDLATLRMSISVSYPASIRQVARQLREHVQNRVGELTGLAVRQVDIDVADLHSKNSAPRRVR